jgi:predicted regulator of Ras-like GTPase activity (Roadblock/LC7/MglB family)
MKKIRYLTIISHEGLTIYHYPFIRDKVDVHLFSGFSSAILSITHELEDELISINMEKQKIFFQKIADGVFVLSVDRKANYNYVRKRLRLLKQSETIKFLLADLDIGTMISVSEELDEEIETIFDMPIRAKIKTPPMDISKDIFLEALEELESI